MRCYTPAYRQVLLSLFLFLTLASSPALPQQEAQVVKVGLFPLPPIIYLDENDQPQGLYVDLLKELAARENWQIQYEAGTWAEGLDRVTSGEIDLMTSIIHSPEREPYLDFCQETVMLVWGQVFARENAQIQNILELDGRRVAVMMGDQNGRNFQANVQTFGLDCEIVAVGSHHEVFQMVQRGDVSAGVAPNLFGYIHSADYGLVQTPILFNPSSITFAAAQGTNAELLAAIDHHLMIWKKDKDSVYYQILNHWFGQGGGQTPMILPWLKPVALGVAFLALLLLLWTRSLKMQVQHRTRQLQSSEAKIRAIFNETRQFLGVLDLQGRLQDVNRTAVDFIGAASENLIGLPFWDCPWWNHDPQQQQECRQAVANALAGGIANGQAIHPDKDGQPHKIEYTIKPIIDRKGQVILLIAEGLDVTEKEQMEKALRHSQKMEAIGNLAGGIAHDFNNILTAMMGFNELAQEDLADRPEAQKNLQGVSLATVRARDLVRQILTFSRRRDAEPEVIQPGPVVSEAVHLLRSSLPSTIPIELDISADSWILADPTQVHQIVMNLGTNAFHAMKQTGGQLTVGLDEKVTSLTEPVLGGEMPPGRYVRLEVSDTGAGMDPDTLEKIFEPFFTSKNPGQGTGLGLSVVHGIVNSSRGHIKVTSELGMGSRFEIFFPATDEKGQSAEEALASDSIAGGSERVLFVDDEESITELAARFFTALGYRLRIFNDSSKALACFRESPQDFDIAITDQTMPGITGLQLARAIRQENPDIPIIIITGDQSGIHPQKLELLGACRLLQKPLKSSDLHRTVRQILD